MQIKVQHPEVNGAIKGYLSQPVQAGDEVLYLQSAVDFDLANNSILIGDYGQERAEIQKNEGAVDEFQVEVSGLWFPHPSNTPVYNLEYNRIRVYRSSTETGSYTLVGTYGITPEQPHTVIEDPDGNTSSWYRISYYHSLTANESGSSDPMQASGPKRGSVRTLINRVRKYTGVTDPELITDEEIIDMFNECLDEIQDRKGFPKSEGSYTETSDHTATSYPFPNDCLEVRSLRLTSGTVYYYPIYKEYNEFKLLDGQAGQTTNIPMYYTIWNEEVIFSPNFVDDTITIDWKYISSIPTLDTDNDVPQIKKPEILTFYACMMISVIRTKPEDIAYWSGRYENRLKTMLSISGKKQSTKFNRVRRPGIARVDDPQRSVRISVPTE